MTASAEQRCTCSTPSSDPTQPLWLTGLTGQQSVVDAAHDGQGGLFVLIADQRSLVSNDLYLQRATADGAIAPGWPADGIAVCVQPGNQSVGRLLSDGAGGAIAVCEDLRSGNRDLYASRIDATGALVSGWVANGNQLTSAAVDERAFDLCTDGAGGAIVVYTYDFSGTDRDIFAARITGAGVLQSWGALAFSSRDQAEYYAVCQAGIFAD